ncbi:UNVERIFIED_CONTAM: Mllt10 [Trichonephila clavipes]
MKFRKNIFYDDFLEKQIMLCLIGWAHVVCALYIPEVRFGNVTTMEPIILQLVPQERYNKEGELHSCLAREHKVERGNQIDAPQSLARIYREGRATCYICEEQGKESKASVGACMQCNKSGCKQYFHVTWKVFDINISCLANNAQAAGLLCEEAGNYMDNVKYCGYCHYHYQKLWLNQRD